MQKYTCRNIQQKDSTKSKLNRFYVTIKLGLNMIIFQQRIIWEELFQINDMWNNFNRWTFRYPYLYRTIWYPVADLTQPALKNIDLFE